MIVQSNHSLKDLNTFGIDVTAKYFAEASHMDDFIELLQQYHNEEILILGGGSNVLFTKDFDGLVIKNNLKGISIVEDHPEYVVVKAAAGEIWHELVLWTIEKGFGGIENLSLIPGCVGASPMQNIGAYGVELKDCFHSLEALNRTTKEITTFNAAQCAFGYRESVFKHEYKNQFIILSVSLKLFKHPIIKIEYGDIRAALTEKGIQKPTIKDVSDAVIAIRQSKLPDPKTLGNAGSFFKNPIIDTATFDTFHHAYPQAPFYKNESSYKIPAGWLIEQCGWKGKVVGHVGAHAKQALVLVNYGSATGEEIKKIAFDIQHSVFQKFNIRIEPEVNFY